MFITSVGGLLAVDTDMNYWIYLLTSLTPPLFTESLYQTRKVRCHVFVCYGYRIASDFAIWFWNCSDNVVFFVFHFY